MTSLRIKETGEYHHQTILAVATFAAIAALIPIEAFSPPLHPVKPPGNGYIALPPPGSGGGGFSPGFVMKPPGPPVLRDRGHHRGHGGGFGIGGIVITVPTATKVVGCGVPGISGK